jgi:hypothetical protein
MKMNGDMDSEGDGRGPILVSVPVFSRMYRGKLWKSSMRLDNLANIRTEYLPDTSLERYRYTNLLILPRDSTFKCLITISTWR